MKAWSIASHGGVDVLQLIDKPEPTLKEDGAIVRVSAVGLNHLDLWVRKGVPGHRFPLPITPGCDTVGVIEALDAEAQKSQLPLKVGQRVLIQPGFSCGVCLHCKSGDDPLCTSYGILGETTDGGCADKIAVNASELIPLPDTLTDEQAAALPIPYLTAYSMLVRKAQVKPGELVLIQGGSSGVSLATLDLCKNQRIETVVLVRGAEKAQKLRSLGASLVIDRTSEDPRPKIKEWLKSRARRGFDVAIDHNGQATFSESLRLLDRGGRLATCGATTGGEIQIDLKAVFFKNISILGTTMGARADLNQIVSWAGAGRLSPQVDRIFPMAQLPQAHTFLESGQAMGKVIVRR